MSWSRHLCEYYNVTPEKALELGTRKTGRRPDLPESETCSAVSGLNLEEIWSLKERKDTQSVFDFYKDQGAWSTFRQCVRHKDMTDLHMMYFQLFENKGFFSKDVFHICEYGGGVAPFLTTFLEQLREDLPNKVIISVVDVDCEHLNFAKYRINKIIEEKKFKNIKAEFYTVEVDKLPEFNHKLDVVFCFEVLEHVPSPVKVIRNIHNQMNQYGLFIENFIKHGDEDNDDGPDLLSARKEREGYYLYLEENMKMVSGNNRIESPNSTRIWQLV